MKGRGGKTARASDVPSSPDAWRRLLSAREQEERVGKKFLFSSNFMPDLLRSLGRVGDASKRQLFVLRAEKALVNASHYWQDMPSGNDIAAIRGVAERAERLQCALQRLRRYRTAMDWMARAWSPRVSRVAAPAPLIPFDALAENVKWLMDSAQELLPKRKRGRRVREDVSGLAILLLAGEFRATFGMVPTLGTNSPFIRFADLAMPTARCALPSADRIRRIVERVGRIQGTIDPGLAFSETRIF